VRFRSFDAIVASLPPGRLLMKVDVEGTEDAIFVEGMKGLAERHPHVLCELLPGTDPRGVVPRMVKELGYECYLVRNGFLERHGTIVASAQFHDWLFTTDPPDELSRKVSVPVR
jgi:hypothetical protein